MKNKGVGTDRNSHKNRNNKNILEDLNLPSEIKNFRLIVESSLRLLDKIEPTIIPFSPFSVIPVLSQALGLNTPLLGSGDSPYTIISIIFQLADKADLLNEIFAVPLSEKRRVINEMYEMIAPALLDEMDDYTDLLVETKYRSLFEVSQEKLSSMKAMVKEKFSILSPFIDRFSSQAAGFGYIAHYGYSEDLYREFDFLESLPDDLAKEWRDRSYPVVNEIFMRGFPSIDLNTRENLRGWVLFVTNHTRELLENSSLRKRKILQAARLAKRLGAELIGMGGLISSFAQGGYHLAEGIEGVGFTTGHAYTIGNIIEIMEKSLDRVALPIKKTTISIVGAAGSIGSGCARLLAERSPGQIILIDLSTFKAMNKLTELSDTIRGINPEIEVRLSTSLKDIQSADVVISATNSPTSIVTAEYLKPGAIIIDDAFPKNVNKNILNKRDDIILLEGGIMQFPSSIEVYFSRNMPDLMDVPLTRLISCKESYGCVAETFTLALYNHQGNYGLGPADPGLAKDIMTKAKGIGFSSAPLQCFDEAVEEERIKRVTEIISKQIRER